MVVGRDELACVILPRHAWFPGRPGEKVELSDGVDVERCPGRQQRCLSAKGTVLTGKSQSRRAEKDRPASVVQRIVLQSRTLR
jgi:hypothetical protein